LETQQVSQTGEVLQTDAAAAKQHLQALGMVTQAAGLSCLAVAAASDGRSQWLLVTVQPACPGCFLAALVLVLLTMATAADAQAASESHKQHMAPVLLMLVPEHQAGLSVKKIWPA